MIRDCSLLLTLTSLASAFWAEGPIYNYDLIETANTCMRFECNEWHAGGTINMQEQVYCYKQDVADPFTVKLKTCGDGQFCNADLNRCARDPYQKVNGKNPGSLCTQHFECKSKRCDYQKGVCLPPEITDESGCKDHSECAVGFYCGESVSV